MGTEEGLVMIFITSLPLLFLISTDGIIPSLLLTLFGRSSNNFFTSFIPTRLPLSSRPIINFPPSALAKAQITLRNSSLQLDLYSVFWLSIVYDIKFIIIIHMISIFHCLQSYSCFQLQPNPYASDSLN